ncbi:heavy-metal-associated domain-containing protein [Streptacidiphilus carbonis]|jgi:copper chaperone CopZ|uniref:heavy-metal-associated domain-containing protein n=1 Tax=Streptacidiphilus carbonis TaxID=105422 RepID=UPI0005AA90A9|nr:heavy-metal-associated domain-containing protein [Streptacidiphilus carbonis]
MVLDKRASKERPLEEHMSTAVFTVSGMSCGHCEKSVSEEISALPGVTGVSADAKAGTVTVDFEQPLADEAVRSAVDEAGYQLVGRV